MLCSYRLFCASGVGYNGAMVITLIAAALLGVAIGLLSGLLGIGGGVVMVPVFRLLFGMSALASTATSLFTIIPTSISGMVSHVRNKTCVPKLGVAMGLGGACMSPLGVWLAQISPSWAVMLVAAFIIGYSAFNMVKKVRSSPKDTAGGNAPTSSAQPAIPELDGKQLAIGVAIGLIAGVMSGYVGVGGGFIMVPLMLAWIGIPMKLASGTSLIAIMILAIPGAIEQGLLGNIDYLVGIVTAVGTVPGAFLGARLTARISERTLRIVFAIFLAVGAILLIAKEVTLFV